MPQLNPYAAEQIKRRELAELIAKQKRIKVKSAMRYLQRAIAPIGKQRIVKPKFTGLKPKLKRDVVQFVESEKLRITKPETWYEKYTRDLKALGDQVAAGEYTGKFLGIGDLQEGTLLDKLAVLSNLHTTETAAEILDTDADLLIKAIQGGALNRLEQAELTEQYYYLVRDEDLQDEYEVDIDYVEREAAVLRESLKLMDDINSMIIFRNAVADGEVSLDKLEKGYTLFGNLTRGQLGKILDAFVENQSGMLTTSRKFDLDEMFDAYEGDGQDFWDIEESDFWAWFRELFY